jgi:uncharacterized membrane protein required for colicin V production
LSVLVLVFAVRGLIRGTVAQVLGFVGVLLGLWAAAWTSQWVGHHWQGARPAVVFLALQWLVACLVGLAIVSLFQWAGDSLGQAVKGSVVGWLDRLGGFVAGLGVGWLVIVFLVLALFVAPLPRPWATRVAHAKTTVPLLRAGAHVCAFGGEYLPGGGWLQDQFLSAEKRAESLSARQKSSKKT